MDLVTPLMQTLQANATLQHTEAQTQDIKALGQQRLINTQIMGLKLQQDQANRAALMQAMSGQSLDPGIAPSANDTPIQASNKNIARLQQEAQYSRQIANTILRTTGDSNAAEKYFDDARQAAREVTRAQREGIEERRTQLKVLGGLANTVVDDDSFQMAYKKIADVDPQLAQGLLLDRDTAGQPVFGPRTQRTMATLANSSMTMNEQMDKQIRAAREIDYQHEIERKAEDDKRKAQETDSKVARNQAQAKYYDKRAGAVGATKAASSKPVEVKPATGVQKKSAAAAVDAEYPDAEFDGSKDAFVADVADRANKIMAEAKKRGDTVGLDDARQQALDELKGYVTKKDVGKPKSFLGIEFGKDSKLVNTYTRGGASKTPDAPTYSEGQTATNPKTGEKRVYRNGEWQPM